MNDILLSDEKIKILLSMSRCNVNNIDFFSFSNLQKEIEAYCDSFKNWNNYPQLGSLKEWIFQPWVHPNINPNFRMVIDAIKSVSPQTACEIGAGAGLLAKYIYYEMPHLSLSCLEGGNLHLAQMKENFDQNNHTIPPFINVPAKIIQGCAQNIPFNDAAFDLVYTHAVMMHMPFVAALLAVNETARISARYVLHFEGFHTAGIIIPNGMSEKNRIMIDYEKAYSLLGFKTIRKEIFPYPCFPDYRAILYMAERK